MHGQAKAGRTKYMEPDVVKQVFNRSAISQDILAAPEGLIVLTACMS